MNYNILFFHISVFFYSLGTFFYVKSILRKESVSFIYSKQWFAVAFVAGAFFLYIRYRELAHLPIVTLFEITFFYAWLLSLIYLVFVKEGLSRFVQGLALFIFDGIFLMDIFLDKKLYPLNPLLNSFWLGIHVPVVMLSYSAFGISFAVSLYCIFADIKKKPVEHLAPLNSGLIAGGVILLGIGIATGSLWAKTAWGTYWSWDPKETWALITFIIYGCAFFSERLSSFLYEAALFACLLPHAQGAPGQDP
ncbi:MAG: cytochrome c biogenesis protein CcsA [Candidatus Omnitrophica bacterium]|nr:cytochrome c biogenesis protein CcsA [Candidatus Omnitrophota bacterium]